MNNFKMLMVGAAGLVASFSVPAATIVSESFTLTYDETTIFGDPTLSSGPGSLWSFSWSVPDSVEVIADGSDVVNTFALPSFTITVNAGHVLSGPIAGFLGNLAYVQTGFATAVGQLQGTVTLNGSLTASMPPVDLTKNATVDLEGLQTGFMTASMNLPLGEFTSFEFFDGVLGLGGLAGEGGIAVIAGQPQNQFSITFAGAPVPVPAAGWLFSAAVCGLALRRRRQAT